MNSTGDTPSSGARVCTPARSCHRGSINPNSTRSADIERSQSKWSQLRWPQHTRSIDEIEMDGNGDEAIAPVLIEMDDDDEEEEAITHMLMHDSDVAHSSHDALCSSHH